MNDFDFSTMFAHIVSRLTNRTEDVAVSEENCWSSPNEGIEGIDAGAGDRTQRWAGRARHMEASASSCAWRFCSSRSLIAASGRTMSA